MIQANTDSERKEAAYAHQRDGNDKALERFLLAGYRAIEKQGVTFTSEESSLEQVKTIVLLSGTASYPPALFELDFLDRRHNVGKITTKDGVEYYMDPKGGAGDMRFSGKTTDAWHGEPCKSPRVNLLPATSAARWPGTTYAKLSQGRRDCRRREQLR